MELTKNNNHKFSSNKTTSIGSYSDSDEKLFNKSISQSEQNEIKRESVNTAKNNKNKASIKNLDSQSKDSNTQEYSSDDMQKFEKLITKEQSVNE